MSSRDIFLSFYWCLQFSSNQNALRCELWLGGKRESYVKPMCVLEAVQFSSISDFSPCHISSTAPGRNSFCPVTFIPCSPSCALHSTSGAGGLDEARSPRMSWLEVWWQPFFCFWPIPWMAFSEVQAGLELPWVRLSGFSSSQGVTGLCSVSTAPTVPALSYWQRGTHIGACIYVQQSPLLTGQRHKFNISAIRGFRVHLLTCWTGPWPLPIFLFMETAGFQWHTRLSFWTL